MVHFIAFAFVIGMLYAIFYFGGNDDFLPVIIVALSWGIGMAIHYFRTFGTEHLDFLGISPNWEEKEVQKEVEKLKRKRELIEQLRKEKELLEDLERLELKEIEKRTADDEFLPEQ